MILQIIALADLSISNKIEIVDCFTPATNIRFVALNGVRSFRIYLNPTGKADCRQLPRGINVTVFATALVDGSNNFIPNSVIVYDYNYDTSVGLSIPCVQCTDNTYFSSDQVIITFESAIHYTRTVMGAVQTERGLQGNCFSNIVGSVDANQIAISSNPSGNCPQLVSGVPTELLAITAADLYVIYENGDIDRYEKLNVATQFSTVPSPASASAATKYLISMTGIGSKPLLQSVQFLQLQLYYVDSGVPIVAAMQTTQMQYASFAGAFIDIQMQVQSDSAYVDMIANTVTPSPVGPPFKNLAEFYNYQIFYLMQPDSVITQLVGFSNSIPSNYLLHSPFQTKSIAQPQREPLVTLTVPLTKYGFVTIRFQVPCIMALEKDCKAQLARILATQDSNFQLMFVAKFYKNNVMLKAGGFKITKIYDSCFVASNGFIGTEEFTLTIEKNEKSKNCQLIEGQKVDVNYNFTEFYFDTHTRRERILNFNQVEFKYNLSLPLSAEIIKDINTYVGTPGLVVFMAFSVNGKIVEQVNVANLYKNDLSKYTKNAQNMIIILGSIAIGIAFITFLIPVLGRKLKPKFAQRKQLKNKLQAATMDKFDL
ncbi:Conserved_hypothetical protein [Hexamita inflata]|uniref:Transmembrane protein n=1 Tax=Hexamita inflata TaxID=28002 RepID=A0AA86QRQ3_9EUKA|nr:Conserved hypothetical protein [Hexamita inflata]